MSNASEAAILYVVATPIGNLEDITLRALRVLQEAHFIVAEDTRHSRKLLDHYGIKTPFASSYYQGVERERVFPLLDLLQAGKTLALISDAGTPLLSDPGYPLLKAAIASGIEVVPVPGPAALMAALVKAGFPTDRFIFDGTPAKKEQARTDYFNSIQGERRTVALYESSHRIEKTLETIDKILPKRPLALCRELTKVHEEALFGNAQELLSALKERPSVKGEFVLIVHGADENDVVSDWEGVSLAQHVGQLIERGQDRKTAIKTVAQLRGMPKREVFAALEKAKS